MRLRTVLTILILITLILGPVIYKQYFQKTGDNKPLKVRAVDNKQHISKKVIRNNNKFAFEIYHAVRDEKEGLNLFFSPYSISTAIAMAFEGAKGDTRTEIQQVMHYIDNPELHGTFYALQQVLKNTPGVTLNVANSTWAQKGYPFLDDYLDTMQEYYGGVYRVDYIKNLEPSRVTINKWVSDKTQNQIPELIPQGVIDASTRLILVNAIDFEGLWNLPFSPDETFESEFYVRKKKNYTAQMMRLTEHPDNKIKGKRRKKLALPYYENEETGDQVLELAYEELNTAMILILPGQDRTVRDVEDAYLTTEGYRQVSDLQSRHMEEIQIPKFEIESDFELSKTLKAMGMPLAFSGSANFSGMDGTQSLKISKVIHKAKCKTNEKGSKASASTAVVAVRKAMSRPKPPAKFIANRPFVIMIKHKQTDGILFMGRVINPGNGK